jgi:hypothetical protein
VIRKAFVKRGNFRDLIRSFLNATSFKSPFAKGDLGGFKNDEINPPRPHFIKGENTA